MRIEEEILHRLRAAMLLAALTPLLLWAGLGSALRTIEACSRKVPLTVGSPATAHLFIIINPFSGGGLLRLLSTHPPTEARVERLVAMPRRGVALGA